MFGIGSGVAALYPLATEIVKNELEETKIQMFLGFRSVALVPMKQELRALADFWNFECALCLSSNESKIYNNKVSTKIFTLIFTN